MKTLPFIKMQGLGNDYVYIDCFDKQTYQWITETDLHRLVYKLSDRHFGVGADGVVLIMPSKEGDAKMRIFNADGSEAQMCGNAIRCVGKYLYESGIVKEKQIVIETLAGMRELTLHDEKGIVREVTVNMGVPIIKPDAISFGADPRGFIAVEIGNPHAVFFRDTVIAMDELGALGAKIGTHPHFPEGTNVEFVRVRTSHEIDVRVWERGTGITLACGTGACAASVAAIHLGWIEREVTVHLPGGELLIEWPEKTKPVFMTGPAEEVYRGEYKL